MNQQDALTSNHKEILASLQSEIAIAESRGDYLRLSKLQSQFGQALFTSKDHENGFIQLDKAINSAQKIGDLRLEANLIGAKGMMHVEKKQMDEGYKCFQQVFEIAKNIGDLGIEGDALSSMGMVQLETGDPASAIDKFNEALRIAEANKDRLREMNHLNGLGNIYLTIAAEDQAIHFFKQSYEIAKELKDEQAQAGLLNNIAIIQKNANNIEEALKLFEQVRSLTRNIDDIQGERNALRHLINIYSESNRNNDLVIEYIRRAIHISHQLNDYPSEATYYDTLILVLLTLNRNAEALGLIDDALQDKRLPEIPEREMQLFVNRGNACFDGNQLEQALNSYNKALKLSVRKQNKNVEARMLGRIGAVQAELGNFESAVEHAKLSLYKAEQIEDTRLVIEQCCMLALANRDLGEHIEAISYCEKAINLFDISTSKSLKEKVNNLLTDLRTESES